MNTTDVFLCFRCQDVGKTFVSHFRRELSRQGITWFKTEEEKKQEEKDRGWQILPAALRAFAESRVALVVLSKNYASSVWCLDELDKIMGCAQKKAMVVVPIFYEVDLSDVRHQTGIFGEAFERHDQVENPKTVQRWREALIKLTDNPGFSSHDSVDDSHLSHEITRHVSGLLSKSRLHKELLPAKANGNESIAKKTSLSRLASNSDQLVATIPDISDSLVAMDRHMEKIDKLMKLKSTSEICVIAIAGVSGIGKTTIAWFLSRKLSPTFQDHCFIETPRNIVDHTSGTQGIGKTSGARSVYQKLAPAFQDHCLLQTSRNIHDQGQHISDASSLGSREQLLSPRGLKRKALQTISDLGSYDKRTSFWHQRVLVVVDDVETSKQLEEIMKDVNRLGPGSRVIITTQDKSLLLACGVEHIYEVECLRYDEALELFSVYAFKKQYPPAKFEELSVRAVQLTGCLPLGLKLLGSFLSGKTKNDWERELQRLEGRQDKAITELSELLKFSTNGRTKEDREWEVRMLKTKQDKAIVEQLNPIPQGIPHNKVYFPS